MSKEVERVKMFTDGVFAIALTLLVLELRLPEMKNINTAMDLFHSLKEMKPHFLAFILSAVLVGGNWISVTNVQRMVARVDLFFVADLVFYLIIISLMPFCCNLIGSYPENPTSYVVFGAVCELLVFNAFFFIRHCRKKNLFYNNADIKEIKRLEFLLLIVSVLIGGMICFAFYNTTLCFVILLAYNLIPFFLTQRLKINESASEAL